MIPTAWCFRPGLWFRKILAVVEGACIVAVPTRGHYSEWQQLELSVDGEMSGISNPYSDILVRVDQNGREETARWLRNPTRVEGVKMTYEHQPDLIFPASNEYRRFESVSNGFPGMHVDSLRYMGSNYHVWLKKDEPRMYREYEYDRTQHGRFLIREYNSTDSDLGADYITVHFFLEDRQGFPMRKYMWTENSPTANTRNPTG